MLKYIYIIVFLLTTSLFAGDVVFVGVAGGSGSGKTTLAKKIYDAFGDNVVVIEQDAYYKDLSSLPEEERDYVNFDHPNSLDFALLKEHLTQLKEGKCINKPIYDFKTHTRKSETVRIVPKKVILVEGILLFAIPDVRDLFDLKIYVDNHEDIRLLRRMERDIKERGRDFEGVRDQYLATVKPMHVRYVEHSKWFADIIIPSVSENDVGLSLIILKLKTESEKRL